MDNTQNQTKNTTNGTISSRVLNLVHLGRPMSLTEHRQPVVYIEDLELYRVQICNILIMGKRYQMVHIKCTGFVHFPYLVCTKTCASWSMIVPSALTMRSY